MSAAEAARRLREEGPNRLVRRERLRTLAALLSAVADPMALMLAAAGAVYFLLGDARDGIILLLSLVPVLGVDVALDLRSRAALRKLADAVSPLARVRRDATEREIAAEDIVRGDLLLLRKGEIVHADAAVREQANLSTDESQLTGESEPQDKPVGSAVYAGSLILGGQGVGEVTHTGRRTRFGAIAELVAHTDHAPTPLQRKIGQLVRRLGAVALLLAAGMAAYSFWRGEGAGRALLSGISLAMAAVPEEFPLVLALFLSAGAYRLSKAGVLVRRLASVETLGSTTVICTDKTGTLTWGRFGLEELVPLSASEHALLAAAVQACERDPEEPMERAILDCARGRGLAVPSLQGGTLAVDYAFDPVEKTMAHVWREAPGQERLAAKGAPEGIFRRCRLSTEERAAAQDAQQRMAAAGLRVLAVAERSGSFSGDRDRDLRDLQLVGLLGFSDPLRPQVPAAIAECQGAGVRVKVVTGDSPITARAIADAAGIHREEPGGLLEGDQLSAAGSARILRAGIYARVHPGQKHFIVEAQQAGEIVAMTGDGWRARASAGTWMISGSERATAPPALSAETAGRIAPGPLTRPRVGVAVQGRVASSSRNQIDRYGLPVARAIPISQVRLLE